MIEFYDQYFNYPAFSKDNSGHIYKDEYLRNMLSDGYLYKFVSLNKDESLNNKKLEMLSSNQIWASNYRGFSDKKEVEIKSNVKRIHDKTGTPTERIQFLINISKQMNDISCFTYRLNESMWDEYANHGSGFCQVFEMLDSDKFFPIIYLDKSIIDYTDNFINLFQNEKVGKYDFVNTARLAMQPWLVKDYAYKNENEIRFLCGDVYDSEQGALGGRIFPNKKEMLGYNGTEYSFQDAGIKLVDIIVGKNVQPTYAERIYEVKSKINEKFA